MYYENPDLLYNEETEMAKYMTERAPNSGLPGAEITDKFTEDQRRTARERAQH